MIWVVWNGHSLTEAFFPLIFLLAVKWLKSGKISWGLLLSLAFALQIFSGYPQIILYEILALISLVTFNFDLKRVIPLGIFLILGVGLSAIQIIPALEILKLSQRGVEDVLNTSAFLPWQYLITFFAPDFFGNHSTGNFWGEGDYTLVTGYSGVVTIILAGLGLMVRFQDKNVRFAASLILISLLIALQNPISIFLKESGLLALQAASAHRSLILSNLGFAILAGFGLEVLSKEKLQIYQKIRVLYLPGIFILGFGIAAFSGLTISNSDPHWYANFKVALKNLVLPAGILILSAILLFYSDVLKKYNRLLIIALVLLGFFELFRFGWKFTPFSEKNLVFPKTPILEFLKNQEKPFRVVAEDVIPINFMMAYGLQTVEGYDAVYPLNFAKYLSFLNSGAEDATPMGRYGSVTNFNSLLLDNANAKYILALKREANGKPDPNGQIPPKFQKTNLKKVFEDKSVAVLENINISRRVYLENDLSKIVNYKESPNLKEIEFSSDKEDILHIQDAFYPGWKAIVDGEEKEILQSENVFMAIPIVSNGQHLVKIEYRPESFQNGKVVTLASVMIILFLLLIARFKKYAT